MVVSLDVELHDGACRHGVEITICNHACTYMCAQHIYIYIYTHVYTDTYSYTYTYVCIHISISTASNCMIHSLLITWFAPSLFYNLYGIRIISMMCFVEMLAVMSVYLIYVVLLFFLCFFAAPAGHGGRRCTVSILLLLFVLYLPCAHIASASAPQLPVFRSACSRRYYSGCMQSALLFWGLRSQISTSVDATFRLRSTVSSHNCNSHNSNLRVSIRRTIA